MKTSGSTLASSVLMVEPLHSAANPETAASNVFQSDAGGDDVGERARAEFHGAVAHLRDAGVNVVQLPGSADPLPDEVFPNNWFSTHEDGTLVLYPMESPVRRRERRADLPQVLSQHGFVVQQVVDLTSPEDAGDFLEGTGSLVLDHVHRRAFASRSSRTHPVLVEDWCERMGFAPVLFDAVCGGKPVYHTNVVLSLGETFAVIAMDAVPAAQRRDLRAQLAFEGREVIEISLDQMLGFGANILALQGDSGPIIALSQTAYEALKPHHEALAAHGELVAAPIPTIEAVGGGSMRCMLAEIRLPRRA